MDSNAVILYKWLIPFITCHKIKHEGFDNEISFHDSWMSYSNGKRFCCSLKYWIKHELFSYLGLNSTVNPNKNKHQEKSQVWMARIQNQTANQICTPRFNRHWQVTKANQGFSLKASNLKIQHPPTVCQLPFLSPHYNDDRNVFLSFSVFFLYLKENNWKAAELLLDIHQITFISISR